MTDAVKENPVPNEKVNKEIHSESYEEITIIITGKEAKLVLSKEAPTDNQVDVSDSIYKAELLRKNSEGRDEKLSETKNSRFECSSCNFATAYRGALQRHISQTHGLAEKKHRCELCGFSTHRKGNLEVHVRTHTKQKPFKCDECDYASSQSSTLKQHVLYRHGERGETYECAACSYTTRVKHTLAVHMRNHTGEKKPLNCTVCDFETGDKNELNGHLTEAHGEEARRYKCANCNYSTHVRRLLVVHMSVHSNRKPFGCELCEFKSASKSSLRTHVLLKHSDELKRYRCEYCGYSTHISGHLIRHVRTHTNEKPYKCEVCDFASAQSGNLKHHVLAKHGLKST